MGSKNASIDNKLIENVAVGKVRALLDETRIIDTSLIQANDKTASWDGDIIVYNGETWSKDRLLKAVPVQIKGHSSIKGHKSYPIYLSDLKNYRTKGLVLFFVVNFNNESFDEYEVFYKAFTLYDLESSIDSFPEEQETKSFEFDSFPLDAPKIKKIILRFVKESNKQKQTIPNVLSMGELLAEKDAPSVKFSVSVDEAPTLNDIVNAIKEQKPYIYYHSNDVNLDFPVDRFKDDSFVISQDKKVDISIDGKPLKKSLRIVADGCSYKFHLDENVFFSLNGEVLSFTSQVKGNLEKRISTLELLKSLFGGYELSIGNDIKVPVTKLSKNTNVNDLERYLNDLKKIQLVFQRCKIHKEYDLDDCDEESLKLFMGVYNCLFEKIPYPKEGLDKDGHRVLKIFGLKILLFSTTVNGGWYICPLFDSVVKLNICDDQNNIISEKVSPYYLLSSTDENFLEVDNIDFDEMFSEIFKKDLSEIEKKYLNMIIMNMLSFYDSSNDRCILDQAVRFSKKLYSISRNDYDYIDYLQAIKRKRSLGKNEIKKLRIINSNGDKLLECSKQVLLGSFEKANEIYESLPENYKERYNKDPIYKLLKAHQN